MGCATGTIAMRHAILLLMLVSSAVAQEPDAVGRLKDALKPAPIPPIERVSRMTIMALDGTVDQSHKHAWPKGFSESVLRMLPETSMADARLDTIPKKAYVEGVDYFQVKSVDVDS